MEVIEQYTELVHVDGRPGSKMQVGMSTRDDGRDPVVRLWIAKPDGSGDYDPHSSCECAQWTLDYLNGYAYRHLNYTPPPRRR
jgi:hypothetical protein